LELFSSNHKKECTEEEKLLWEDYRLYGKKLPNKLKGAFSFTLHDSKSGEFFCARDPLGIAALYYVKTQDGYHFASEIETLLALPSVSKKPNLRSMQTMMQGFAVGYHDTMYEGIYRLPPGHKMSIKNGKKEIERYWFPEKIKIDYVITEEEAAKKLKALFAKAVEESVMVLEETAFELSGGLDSSSVVSLLAQQNNPKEIDSYSMDFGELKCNEGVYVDDLLGQYPVNHKKVSVGTLDYRNKYSLAFLYTLSPHWPVSLTFAMLIPMLEKMKDEGKKVVVTGQGGDHLFTGTPYVLYDLLRRGKFSEFNTELQSYRCPWSAFKTYALRPLLGEKNVERVKKILGKKEKEASFWDDCNIENLTDGLNIKNFVFKEELDIVTAAYHATVMDGNIFHCAERYFGIEYRHPFFDRELVEFALSLPPEMKYAKLTIKRILRKAMEGILPEKIRLRRDKAEFSEVLSQQIEAIDLDILLNEPHIVKLGLLKQSDIEECKEGYKNGKPLYVSRLWSIINVEYWYRYNQFEADETQEEQKQ